MPPNNPDVMSILENKIDDDKNRIIQDFTVDDIKQYGTSYLFWDMYNTDSGKINAFNILNCENIDFPTRKNLFISCTESINTPDIRFHVLKKFIDLIDVGQASFLYNKIKSDLNGNNIYDDYGNYKSEAIFSILPKINDIIDDDLLYIIYLLDDTEKVKFIECAIDKINVSYDLLIKIIRLMENTNKMNTVAIIFMAHGVDINDTYKYLELGSYMGDDLYLTGGI